MPRTATRTKPVQTTIDDFDPFLDEEEAPVPIPAQHDDYESVEPADLQTINFTILDIAEETKTGSEYHFFKWRLFVECRDSGKKCTFLLNPSKRRDRLMEQLGKELPVHNMTLVKKTFIDERTYKLVTYYELTNYREFSGTINH